MGPLISRYLLVMFMSMAPLNMSPIGYTYISDEEAIMIAQITFGEAGNQSELGKRLVIDSLLNRRDDIHFPNTIRGVIFANGQFNTAKCINSYPVTDEIIKLIKEECISRTNYDVVYFNSGGYNTWGKPLFQEGNHYFAACHYD